jgi:hypothetical protein
MKFDLHVSRQQACYYSIILLLLELGVPFAHRKISVWPALCRRGARPVLVPPDALPEVPHPSRAPLPGYPAAAYAAGHPCPGARAAGLEAGGGSRTSPVGRAPGAAAHIAGSGVPSAGPFQVGRSLGRRFVPGGKITPVTDAGGAGRDASSGRGVGSIPGPQWPGQGQAAHDFRSTATSTTLGGNRAPGLVQLIIIYLNVY